MPDDGLQGSKPLWLTGRWSSSFARKKRAAASAKAISPPASATPNFALTSLRRSIQPCGQFTPLDHAQRNNLSHTGHFVRSNRGGSCGPKGQGWWLGIFKHDLGYKERSSRCGKAGLYQGLGIVPNSLSTRRPPKLTCQKYV